MSHKCVQEILASNGFRTYPSASYYDFAIVPGFLRQVKGGTVIVNCIYSYTVNPGKFEIQGEKVLNYEEPL
jgi:hypothetical protein